MFAKDPEYTSLIDKVSTLTAQKKWDEAIECMQETKRRMLDSNVHFGPDDWCKLAFILQRAGRFDEAEKEYSELLKAIPKIARKYSFLDERDVFVGKPGKQAMYEQIVSTWPSLIKERWDGAKKHEKQILSTLKKILPLISNNPGLMQTRLYIGKSDGVKEEIREALYFAEERGSIIRVKKGRSYQLYLPGSVDTNAK